MNFEIGKFYKIKTANSNVVIFKCIDTGATLYNCITGNGIQLVDNVILRSPTLLIPFFDYKVCTEISEEEYRHFMDIIDVAETLIRESL